MNNINICFLTDDGYVMQTCVAISSILKSKSEESRYNIFILCNEVSNKSEKKLKANEREDFSINIINLKDDDNYKKLDMEDVPASPTAIFKFNIPNILSDLDRVIYLDGDILVNSDLTELYNWDIKDNYIGAVKDTSGLSKTLYRLFIKGNVFYFNSGVMVMNLKKMREDNISDSLIDYRINGYNELMDQDSLNYVLKDKVTELPFKYNTQLMFSYINNNIEKLKKYYKLKDVTDTNQIIDEAVIIHFSGKKKPWKHCDGCKHEDWIYYYYNSPYGLEKLNRVLYSSSNNKFNIKNFIKKEEKNYRRYIFMKKFKKDI